MKRKSILAVIVAVCLMLQGGALVAVASGSSGVGFAGGSGTAADPYQIADASQLEGVRNDLTAHYTLIADIDLSGYESWTPIGDFAGTEEDPDMPDPSVAFTGTFDGDNHTISNLTIADSETVRGLGLFGCTAGAAVIQNLVVENASVASQGQGVSAVIGMALQMNDGAVKNITLRGDNVISGTGMVGGIVGGGYCGIEDCTAEADIIMTGSFAEGSGQSAGILAGGMSDAGMGCTISGCVVNGGSVTVYAKDDGETGAIGGLTGCATDYDAIANCAVENISIHVPDGAVMVGGLIGMGGKGTEGDYATAPKGFTLIDNCEVSNVTIEAEGASRVGGIAGSGFYLDVELYKLFYPVPAAMQIVNCKASGSIAGGELVGSILGYAFHNSVVTACEAEMGGLHQIGAMDAAMAMPLSEVR